jgi:hypothetical protein
MLIKLILKLIMGNLPPTEGGSVGFESGQEFTEQELLSLFNQAEIKQVDRKLILKDFPKATAKGKQWLRLRLESIVGATNKISRAAFKFSLKDDWELNRFIP